MNRNKHLARIAAGLAAGALVSMGAVGIAQSAHAASTKDQSSSSAQTSHEGPQGHRGHGGPGGPERADRGAPIHSELVVKLADGSFQTRIGISGTVTAVSSSSITVKAADDYSASFSVSSTTQVLVAGQTATIADLKVGDTAHVHGTKSGTTITAEGIRSGTPAAAKTSSS